MTPISRERLLLKLGHMLIDWLYSIVFIQFGVCRSFWPSAQETAEPFYSKIFHRWYNVICFDLIWKVNEMGWDAMCQQCFLRGHKWLDVIWWDVMWYIAWHWAWSDKIICRDEPVPSHQVCYESNGNVHRCPSSALNVSRFSSPDALQSLTQ